MVFGITLYGLGAVAGLLALYALVVLGRRAATWALAAFVGSVVAFILPAHIAIAVLAFVGVAILGGIGLLRSLMARHLPIVAPVWARTLIATGVAVVATVVWGMATGHSLGGGSATPVSSTTTVDPSTVISAFNASWRESVAITVLGAGVFLAIPVAWYLRRREAPFEADLYLATMGLLAAGAIGWGWRLSDYTMFYLYFAGIAVFATPIAVAAVLTVWERLRATRHLRLALALIVVCLIQVELGATSGISRLQGFGPGDEESIPVSLLDAIKQLPTDAKLAYSCTPFDEVAVRDTAASQHRRPHEPPSRPDVLRGRIPQHPHRCRPLRPGREPILPRGATERAIPGCRTRVRRRKPWPRSSRPTGSTTSIRPRDTRIPL